MVGRYTRFLFFLALHVIANSINPVTVALTKRQLCDLELLLNGGFAPLTGFMQQKDYQPVIEKMHLADGTLWPIPIVLDIPEKVAQQITPGSDIELRSSEGNLLAIMRGSQVWQPDREKEAQLVYGTTSVEHPGVAYLLNETHPYYVGGTVQGVELPRHYDFLELRKTPQELKRFFKEKGYTKVVGFQTRNPIHRAHQELTSRAAKEVGGHLLIHPVVGLTKPGDIDYLTRVRCYKHIIKKYPQGTATLSLLPLSMRMAGPREALWHAIIRKNYGCTHFIVGRDHAGPGKDSSGKAFYEPYAAQELAQKYAREIGIEIVPFQEMVYLPESNRYEPADKVPAETKTCTISGTQLRDLLEKGAAIPDWFSYPEVVQELRKEYPPKAQRGLTLFFTGLSGSGKSTLAHALAVKLAEMVDKHITILDGDNIRKHLSSELGFSKEHRSLNVRRVGFVASEITKHGGIALCALIAPYGEDRTYVRNLIKPQGNYVEIYLSTPLGVCQRRDVKGLYAQANKGTLNNFTGVSDPYEAPHAPELKIDTSSITIDQALGTIVTYLKKEGYIQ
jgi:sulfate adenylyltransferase